MLQSMKNSRHISAYTMNEERSEKLFSGKIDEKQVKDAQDKRELKTTPQKSNDLTHSSPRNEAELVRMQQRGTPTGNWGGINVPWVNYRFKGKFFLKLCSGIKTAPC